MASPDAHLSAHEALEHETRRLALTPDPKTWQAAAGRLGLDDSSEEILCVRGGGLIALLTRLRGIPEAVQIVLALRDLAPNDDTARPHPDNDNAGLPGLCCADRLR